MGAMGGCGRGGDFPGDFLSGAKARIAQAGIRQGCKRLGIVRQMLGLPANWFLPPQTQPSQIRQHGGLVFGAAAGLIDILHPQQKASAQTLRRRKTIQRRETVAQMQGPGGAGSKSEDVGR